MTATQLVHRRFRRGVPPAFAPALLSILPHLAHAQGFDQIETTVANIEAILVTISIAVVTIAIIWAGFKMIFQGARLVDVANVLIGGAAAFASFIVAPT